MIDTVTALTIMRQRLNRLPGDTTLDVPMSVQLKAAEEELEGTGIHLTAGYDDLMLLVDTAVWRYQCRDNPGGMPDWLRLRRRERWLREVQHDT